jgi:hypothetical protein
MLPLMPWPRSAKTSRPKTAPCVAASAANQASPGSQGLGVRGAAEAQHLPVLQHRGIDVTLTGHK